MARTDTPWTEGNDDTYIETIKDVGYNILINGLNKYLNFNNLVGSSGYGIRDNSGVMEFKNSGGAWSGVGSGDLTKALADTYYQPIGSYLTDAPSDGSTYGRKNGAWAVAGSGSGGSGSGEVEDFGFRMTGNEIHNLGLRI